LGQLYTKNTYKQINKYKYIFFIGRKTSHPTGAVVGPPLRVPTPKFENRPETDTITNLGVGGFWAPFVVLENYKYQDGLKSILVLPGQEAQRASNW